MFPDNMNPVINAVQFGSTNSGADTTGLNGDLGSWGLPAPSGSAGAGGINPNPTLGGI